MEDQAKIPEGHVNPSPGMKPATLGSENPDLPAEPKTASIEPSPFPVATQNTEIPRSDLGGVNVARSSLKPESTQPPQPALKETPRIPSSQTPSEVGRGDSLPQAPPVGPRSNGGILADPEELTGEFKPKVPILRLKIKKGDDRMESMTFEKQEASKNDSYCWVCHDGGDVLCCDKCARVFHVQCSGLQRAPEGDEEWFCPVCKNIARKTKRSRPPNLTELLLLAVNRMMFPGTEIFQAPVPDDIMGHYREYIFFPMDLGTIKDKVLAGHYHSTRGFLHDTEWIMHNCIIYNGAKHALTKIAKGIVKVCKEDMREIELCPSCYGLTVNQPKDWFCIPCKPPHRVILAKVRGYPLWPAKLISETSDKCDVRFFGQHDRSLVPKASIQELNGPPPTPTSKTQFWNIAMSELQKYRENINTILQQMGGGKQPIPPLSLGPPATERHLKHVKEPRPIKPREPKALIRKVSPVQQNNHYDRQNSRERSVYGPEASTPMMSHYLPVSNHVPYSPQLVEVSVNLSDTEDAGSMHGYSAVLMDSQVMSEPSSPGSEPELQIDLGGSGGRRVRERVSPGKGRVAQSGNRYMYPLTGNRRTFPVEMASADVDATATGSSVLVSPSGGSPMSTPRNRRKGERLSALAHSLAERRSRVAGGAVLPGLQPSVGGAQGEGGVGQDAMEMEQSQEEAEESALNRQFSSIYAHSAKIAIAVVDPDNKRNRKRKFRIEPPPKKSARIQNMSKSTQPPISNTTAFLDPYAFNEGTSPSPVNLRPHIHEAPPYSSAPNSVTIELPTAISTPPGSSAVVQSPAEKVLSVPPRQPQAKATTPGSHHPPAHPTGKKKPRGRPPRNSAAKTAAAATFATTPPNPTPPTSRATFSTAATSGTSASTMLPLSLSLDTPPTNRQNGFGVRGGAAAPGAYDDESSPFSEGSGLLADTVRKVDRSFRARLNQMAGGAEDMGYQYFSEKFMTSIKTVLIEMLSTFEAKGKMGAKQLREQLHQAWPVPDSRAAIEQLRRELKDEMKQSLEVVRASAELERQQVVSEVKRQAEVEKDLAIAETKKKKWCSYCMKEAQYNCCWNANYCNEACQQSHWPEHMKTCTQVQQQQPLPRTPAPLEMAGTPVSKVPPAPQIPVALPPPGQEPQGGGFVYATTPSSGQMHIPPGHMIVNHNSNSSALGMSSGGVSVGPPALNHTGATFQHHQSQQLQQHRVSMSEQPVIPMHMEMVSHSVEAVPSMESSMTQIEQIPNDSVMLNSGNPPSPPNHIRTLLLNQQVSKSSVITGMPILMSQAQGGHIIEGAQTFALTANPTLVSNSLSSDHSSNNSGSLVNLQSHPPMSPISPPSVNPPLVHNPQAFSWPYQQQHVIIGAENYPHPLPLMPTMQASTPTSQPHQFYKAF